MKDNPADENLQDLDDLEQQQNNPEETQCRSNIDGVTEYRNQLMAMNICNGTNVDVWTERCSVG